MPFGAIIGAAGSLIGGAMQSGAIDGASSQAQALEAQARAQGQTNYNAAIGNAAPFLSAGQGATTQQNALLGLAGQPAATAAMSTFQSSPGYQYALQQGLAGVDQGAAAQGMLRSGNTLKAEQTLGSNLGNQNFQQYFNNLSGLATNGLNAVTADNNATGQYDGVLTGTTQAQAQIGTQAATQDASIYGNTVKGLTGAAGSYGQNSLYSAAMGGSGGFSGGFGAFGSSDPFGGAGIAG